MQSEDMPLMAGWWARLPDGGMKRIWVTRRDGLYACRLELCSAEQEEARARLFDAVNACEALGRPLDPDASTDALIWSCSSFAGLETNDPEEALHFLGNDELARCAIFAAETLASAHLHEMPTDAQLTRQASPLHGD